MNASEENILPGPVVLFGSGETSPSGRKIFDQVFHKLPRSSRVALLETPAGFELNSDRVIGRVGEFLSHRLQNYDPQIKVIPARARGTHYSPDDPQVVAPLLESNLIFMGPGSPSYAVRQLKDSLAWQMLLARHRLGAALVLASAATVAISTYALPVYEIYKVGEDLHWKRGLDFFGLYGMPLVFIPHWNNNDGGDELDTSRCFMGQSRFARLMEMLPPDLTVLGIDEKTALMMDIQSGKAKVIGLGGVTLLHTGHAHQRYRMQSELDGSGLAEVADQRNGHVHYYPNGQSFPLSECCPFEIPDLSMGVAPEIWQQANQARERLKEQLDSAEPIEKISALPAEVQALVEERQAARARKDWASSDALRAQIADFGWQVKDTPDGPVLEKTG
jgi:cyanophycinase-like exopeptidase